MALWYNPLLTMGYLEEINGTEAVFKLWIDKLSTFKHEFELRRILFGLSSVLKIPIENLPAVIFGISNYLRYSLDLWEIY